MSQETDASKVDAAVTETTLRQLDASYRPFPSFQDWSAAVIDEIRWNRYAALLEERGEASPGLLKRARRIAVRAAAVDTGAIERLYEVDRGFTFTVAMETAAWEALISQKGRLAHSLIESQLRAYDYVVDLATRAEPISEAAVRTLHEELVAGQDTYRVVTAIGIQDQPLPKGQYKVLPNHVRRRDGNMHSYAPVDFTPAEMHRFVTELRSDMFLGAHPVLQASYAHYAFVAIHPFADGNGRVARALASVFTYRANSIPLLILADQREPYFAALEAADQGGFQPFVDFALSRALEAMQLVQQSIWAATAPAIDDSLNALKALYITKGGYTHEQVDEFGIQFFEAVAKEVEKALPRSMPQVSAQLLRQQNIGVVSMPNYRHPLQGMRSFTLFLTAGPPAAANVFSFFALQVPRDCGREDDLIILETLTKETFAARIDEVTPSFSSVLQMRIKMFAEGLLSRRLDDLKKAAEAAYRKLE
jgi:Fic family protein